MEKAKKEFEVDHLTIPTGTSFSQLLLADDDVVVHDHQNQNPFVDSFVVDQTYNNNNNLNLSTTLFSFHNNTPKMLCFSNYQNEPMFSQTPPPPPPPHKSVITSTDCDSSSVSSCNQTTNTASFNSLTKSNSLQKKRNGSGQEPGTMEGVVGGKQQQRASKKTRADNPTSTGGGHAKKKEKLGERIAALQQLVSPFGKTDTASVLHEATGYIKFLHDQVQVLCSPYLQSPHIQFQPHPMTGGGGDYNNYNNNGEEVMKDLRSRGLCLIPIGCTLHVASSNGADFWSPAAAATAMQVGNNVLTSGSAKQ